MNTFFDNGKLSNSFFNIIDFSFKFIVQDCQDNNGKEK